MLGPIDFIVVGFKGDNFDGSVLQALSDAAQKGIIRVVDLAFVLKDAEGNVMFAEVEDQSDDLKEIVNALGVSDDLPLLNDEDLLKVGESLENESSAGVLVIEQLWAKDLKQALINVGAELLDEGRIHPEKVEAAVEEIKQSN